MVFQKGQSGNPAGRPKSAQAITPWLRRFATERRAGKTRAEHVADKLMSMAEQGDINAIVRVLERLDGKVTEPVDLTSGGETLRVSVTFDHADEGDE